MSHRHSLMLLGLMLIALGVLKGGWFLTAVWLGCDFLALGIAHFRGFHRVFGKRSDGTLPAWSRLAFLPLLLYTSAVWHILRLFSREPAHSRVTEELVVGRRLLPGELEGDFINYVDLTAEFQETPAIRRSAGYVSFPVLDGSAPEPDALSEMVNRLRPGKTYVHCAQGHGRTGMFALAVMLESKTVRTVSEGLEKLRSVRPGISLSAEQRRCIEKFSERCG